MGRNALHHGADRAQSAPSLVPSASASQLRDG